MANSCWKISYYIFSLWVLLLCYAPSSFAQPTMVLSTFAGPPLSNTSSTGFYDLVLKEAFRRAGVPIEIIQLPAERSLQNANQGITDGDFVRIAGLDAIYPNLVRVEEKITDFEFVGFSKNVLIPITGWEDLRPYDIAIVRGWKILEENIVGSRSLVMTKDQNLLFTLLKNDRVDIVVYSRFEGYEVINTMNLKDARALEPPLAVKEMYLYLNKKHQDLVPAIAYHLKEMKRDGSFEKIRAETLSPFIPGAANVPKN